MQKIATAAMMRPITFDDLLGQEFVAQTLKSALSNGRVASAYLFSGPRGVGKTSAARILARALNCPEGKPGEPCGTCATCQEIIAGSALDIIEIDGASNTSVDHVRQIIDEVLFAPSSGRYKVYIIDEVHMLSTNAFNALLKTIEEPPAYVVFIFATTELHKVPATIKSRCQQFSFRLIAKELIARRLEGACAKQSIVAEREALEWIAREAKGSLRDALTLFDQIAAFSEGSIELEKTATMLGFLGLDKVAELIALLARGDIPGALSFFHDRLQAGVALERFISEFIDYFRGHLFALSGVQDPAVLGWEQTPALPANFGLAQCEAALEILFSLYRDLRYTPNPEADVEIALYRIARLPHLISATELVAELKAGMQSMQGQATGASAELAVEPQVVVQSAQSVQAQQPMQQRVKQNIEQAEPEKARIPKISRSHILILRNQAREDRHQLAALMSSLTGYGQRSGSLILKTAQEETARALQDCALYIRDCMEKITGYPFELEVALEAKQEDKHVSEPAADAPRAAEAEASRRAAESTLRDVDIAAAAPAEQMARSDRGGERIDRADFNSDFNTAASYEDEHDGDEDVALVSTGGSRAAHNAALAADVFKGKLTERVVRIKHDEKDEEAGV